MSIEPTLPQQDSSGLGDSSCPDGHLGALLAAADFDSAFAVVHRLLLDCGLKKAVAGALRWADASEPAVQAAGLDVLAVSALDDKTVIPRLIRLANRVAEQAANVDVRWSAAHALSAQNDRRVLDVLLRFAQDEDGDVRWQVVYGLPALAEGRDHKDPAVTALMTALNDDDADIRSWAAYGLGARLQVDNAEVRNALASLLGDLGGAAGEAAVGLARRKDRRVLPVLREQLSSLQAGNLWVEAAGELGDPSLLPALRALEADHWDENDQRGYLLHEVIQSLVSNANNEGAAR